MRMISDSATLSTLLWLACAPEYAALWAPSHSRVRLRACVHAAPGYAKAPAHLGHGDALVGCSMQVDVVCAAITRASVALQ